MFWVFPLEKRHLRSSSKLWSTAGEDKRCIPFLLRLKTNLRGGLPL